MSTRSQVQFVYGDGDDAHRAQVYRHSDGYPNGHGGVIADLQELYEVLTDTGTHRGPDYAAANFIFIQKMRSFARFDADLDTEDPIEELRSLNQPRCLFGYGVQATIGAIHGGEEFLYVVNVTDDEWTVKVSGDFPRWDGAYEAGDELFDRANWEFIGSLSDAVAEYV